ncbi:MAG TPA: NAD-dependent epimerase/dehydratase [bacterium]|nr:NAD-dependent epimerase/dehydratase [bacterium]
MKTVLVTGGAGYVGAILVPKLLARGYRVKIVDLYLFGDRVLASHETNPALEQIKGDIRDQALLKRALPGCDAVIHLACISNDPSFELNPTLSKSINYDAFDPLVTISKHSGVRRFVYASTSSVYGVSDSPNVTEEHPLVPLTDYNKYKGLCEPVLLKQQSPEFTTVIIRPATVCGYSPRLRLDLSVNILTNLAVNKRKITIFGGSQKRPNIHIEDVTDLYADLLEFPVNQIAGKIFNASYQNNSIAELGEIVRSIVTTEMPHLKPIAMETTPTDDIRSYHVSSDKIRRELGYEPKRTVEDAVADLCAAFQAGRIPNPLEDVRYYNVKTIKASHLV